MKRQSDSHKGENGKVAIIGGSTFQHGAPLMSALSAEASGVDLLFVCVPACHRQVATMQSLNFQVHPFEQDELSKKDIAPLLELLATMDSAVIGPGLGRSEESLNAVHDLIAACTCPMVLDATAIQPNTLEVLEDKTAVLTPHLAELQRIQLPPDALEQTSKELGITILLKGQTDCIATSDGKVHEVSGGNAGLTTGGTGDSLAGLIAGLMAQGILPHDAAIQASTIIKGAADELYGTHGYAYTATDLHTKIPSLIHTL